MRRKLIVFDIDGTLSRHVSSWQYLHEHLKIWDGKADIYQKQFRAGKISYREFCRRDAAHWKGMKSGAVGDLFRKTPYAKNARRCIRKLRKQGFKMAAVSTGLQFMAGRVKRELGLHYVLANRLLERKGTLTGGVRIHVSFGGKDRAFKKIMKKFRIKRENTLCVGDGDGDIPMAKMAGYSIAFNSNSKRLSRMADYNCRSKNFEEVYKAITHWARL